MFRVDVVERPRFFSIRENKPTKPRKLEDMYVLVSKFHVETIIFCSKFFVLNFGTFTAVLLAARS